MKISTILCLLVLSFFAINAVANENEAPAAPAAGEHGAAAPAAVAPPWNETQSRLLGYKSQRQQLMSQMTEFRNQKEHLKMGSPAMKAKAAEMQKAYKDYKDATQEYNKLLVIIKYRFPERFAKEEIRRYDTEEVPSLENLELQLDLDGRLSRSLDKARMQFGTNVAPEKGREPSSVTSPLVEDTNKTIREMDPIILKK